MKLSDFLHKYNQHQKPCCVCHEMVSIYVLLGRLMKSTKQNILRSKTDVTAKLQAYKCNKITCYGTISISCRASWDVAS